MQAGHTVCLIVGDGLGDSLLEGIEVRDVGKPVSRFYRILSTVWLVYKSAVCSKAQVAHIHDPELLLIAPLLRRRGLKVIFDAHEDFPKQILNKQYLPFVFRILLSKLALFAERVICSRLDGVVTATPYIRNKFLDINVNTIDVNNFPIIGEASAGLVNWESKHAYACYVGGIAKIRGIEEMLKAVTHCRNKVRLQIAGNYMGDAVKSNAESSKAWKLVDYHGFLDRNGVARVLNSSMVGLVILHPVENYVDALPVKMFEYMNAGLPVVASNFPLWVDIIEKAQCGICVDPLDALAIAKAIDEVVANPERAKEMGRLGRKAVEEKYNWSVEEGKLLRFYSELVTA